MASIASVLSRHGERVTVRRDGEPPRGQGVVVYWMQRAQRAHDNPALDVAVDVANALGVPCVVFFAPVPTYPHANLRHYRFLQEGIADIAADCERRGVGFVLRRFPEHNLVAFGEEVGAVFVVGDENPLRGPRDWRHRAAGLLKVPFVTVDADVVVPTRVLGKEQYAARIARPRLRAEFERYLVHPKNPKAHMAWEKPKSLASLPPDFDITAEWEGLDRSVKPVTSFRGGTREARRLLEDFVARKLERYPERQGRADEEGTSRLSPYLHFGHIGPLTVALAVRESGASEQAKNKFLDELITWRELAIAFVTYNADYDSIFGAEDWARKTLRAHLDDPRPVLYGRAELEGARTHDPLWNAAQLQMLHTGWMHNYLRMYWAKKILEWSASPEAAFNTAVYLNDKYLLDGRDPNGYAGIAWSIAGKFDRPWFERPIFGLVRYMAESGAKKKFDVERYIRRMNALAHRTREQATLL